MAHKQNVLERLSEAKIMVLGFILVICAGAFLLMLPISSKDWVYTDFLTAIFTSTSATCVTGLVLVDTYTYWSTFGQTVIIVLIQLGGLGFMTMAGVFSLSLKRKISFKQRMLTAESYNQENVEGIINLTRYVIFGTLIFEGIGAIILSFCFIDEYGILGGIRRGVFHSISAFCNAGFDILGDKGEFSSLITKNSSSVVLYTVMVLITIGGLGFSVWKNIYDKIRYKKRFNLHSKLVLSVSLFLVLSGFILFFIFEYSNFNTLGSLSLFDKINNALFQSVTTRTAGFAAIDQMALCENTKFLSVILMFIGGSPGSTAGGIKTVTLAVVIVSAISVIKGNKDVNIFNRRISQNLILRCLAVVVLGMFIILTSTMIIFSIEEFEFMDILFEVTSAFATVGLSAGITSSLSLASKIILIMLMFFGRVGVLTITWALVLKSKSTLPKIRYPKEHISVG